MPGPNLIESVGGQPQEPTRFKSLFTSRFFNGLFTNRSPLRGPLGFLYTDFYHAGTTDVLIDGLNTELSTRLTMVRRPGNSKFSTASVDSAVDSFYSFHLANNSIEVIVDNTDDIDILTPTTNTILWTKPSDAGEAYFVGIAGTLYIADGVDLLKYIPGAINPLALSGAPAGSSIFNFGGAAPAVAPTLVVTQTGSSGVAWQASTWFTTMGLLYDSNNNIEFLLSTMQAGNTTQFGLTGNGSPAFNTAFGATTTDNTVTWTSKGQLLLWIPEYTYAALSPIWDPTSNGVYIAVGNGPFVSGSARPTFNPTFNTHTSDSSGKFGWQYIGPPILWTPSTTFNSFWEHPNEMVVTPVLPNTTNMASGVPPIYVETCNDQAVGSHNVPGTTAANYTPQWPAVQPIQGQVTIDNQLKWICLGLGGWQPFATYAPWYPQATVFGAVVDGSTNFQVCIAIGATQGTQPYSRWYMSYPFVLNQIIAVQNLASATGYTAMKATTPGTSGSTEPTNWNYTLGGTTTDGGVTWTSQGPTTAGVPVFGQNYGDQSTQDGTVTWVCVGTAQYSRWVKNSTWYLPAAGFAPPSASQPYGGANVVGSAYNQFVTQSGESGTLTPSWSTTVGNTTTDNNITWTCVSPFNAVGFTWTKGYGYVYTYKARTSSDVYDTTSPPLQMAGTNSPNIIGPLGPPTGAGDGTETSASPAAFIIGPQTTDANITVSGPGSTDPQFDTVVIYRSTDGFYASGPYLFLTELNMPPVVNGVPGTWSIIDFMPDLPTATLPGLNPLIEAPIDGANNPPPGQYGSSYFTPASPNTPTIPAAGTGLIGLTYHQGRLWGSIGSNVFASGGPDTNPGNGFTAWPATNVFPFQSTVVRLLSTNSGLLVFTTTDLYLIGGGPAIGTYYTQLLVPGLGLLSWNALTQMGGIPYIFSADRQLLGIEPGTGITRAGHNIGNLLNAFNPANVYLTYHSFGDYDHALFISDGATEWYRCDTNLAPDSQTVGPVWSPAMQLAVGGFKAIASTETSPGIRQLLIGPTGPGFVLARDSFFTIFSDAGAPGTGIGGETYPSFCTMGSIVLANPGQMAEMGFLEFDFEQVGTQPTISVLLDEISATNGAAFETLSTFVSDPPKLYGPYNSAVKSSTPDSLWMNRYYFGQTTPGNPNGEPSPAWCKHLQIKVTFSAQDAVQNEMLAFTVWGALWQEN